MNNHKDTARTGGGQDHQLLLKLCFNLCSTQRREGSWDAFTLRPGGSSHWTTGAALSALSKAELVLKHKPLWLLRSVKRGWEYMEKSANLQPVGFNELTPCDADSTCWLARAIVYRLANSPSQADSERLGEWLIICIDYLKGHVDKEHNGIRTYLLEDGIMNFVNRQGQASSWLKVHSCVTANAKSLGHELRTLLPKFAPQASGVFYCLDVGDQPFWWTAPEILGELYADDSARLVGQKITSWILRIPFHDDFTGESSDYSHEADTEGGLCTDSGAFSLALRILAYS